VRAALAGCTRDELETLARAALLAPHAAAVRGAAALLLARGAEPAGATGPAA